MILNPLFIDFWHTASHVQRASGGRGGLLKKHLQEKISNYV